MFVPVVRGRDRDPELTFARLDLWLHTLAPGAPGWLGTTAGVTRDHELVSFVRFASAADARHNSDRIEQAQWWAESAPVFAGDVTFDNYDEIALFGDGGSDAAALVEVLVGRVPRRRAGADPTSPLAGRVGLFSPRVIGGLVGLHDDGHFTQAVYLCHREDEPAVGPFGPASRRGDSAASSETELLRLEHLWFGSPDGAVRRCPGGRLSARSGPEVSWPTPAGDEARVIGVGPAEPGP